MLLSERTAAAVFGEVDPIGRTVAVDVGGDEPELRDRARQRTALAAALTKAGRSGEMLVEFQPMRGAGGELEEIGPVDDTALLGDATTVKVHIDLTVGPGRRWDPPAVDRIALAWTRAPSR